MNKNMNKKKYMFFMLDVKATGPAPGLYSMYEFCLMRVDKNMDDYFHAKMSPLPNAKFDASAMRICNYTEQELCNFTPPSKEMLYCMNWVADIVGDAIPRIISDNPAFDWQFFNYYCHAYLKKNPFGYSARRIGDFYAGLKKDFRKDTEWKRFRKTKHTHNPVDDCRGNIEALLEFTRSYGIDLVTWTEK